MSDPFGSIFPEQIIREEKRRKSAKFDDLQTENPGRMWLFVLLLILGLGLLLARLATLMVFEGSSFRKLSEENRIREAKILSPRGIIYDRNGEILVRNIPTFSLPDGVSFYESKPATISAEFSESVNREYIYGEALSHVLGFVGEVDPSELKVQGRGTNISYTPGDLIGKMGIEKYYDGKLRGKEGRELTEVDALGRVVRRLGKVDPIAGEKLYLSIDLVLQKKAAESFQEKKGAVVATNPATGEVLLLYSSPSFDPNAFVKIKDVESILTKSDQPLFNRAISGVYPPGSTFKIITAISALEEGAISKDTKFEDTGILSVGEFSFGNWYFSQYGKKEGMLDIINAIRRSNDIFFYKTGEAVGIEKLSVWAKKIGLGKTLEIDIPGESTGLMPDPKWQKEAKGEDWYLGNTYHAAIGQGDILTTPLQVNAWTNVIANGGKLCRPHLNNLSNLGNLCKDLGIKKETIDLIREGMREACSPGGTGWPLFGFKIANSKLKIDGIDFLETYESTTSGKPIVGIPTACKTGTSEFGDPKGRTHAWITVFAPVVNPQISVTVLVEGGGEGSSVAGPIAKKVLEAWFGR